MALGETAIAYMVALLLFTLLFDVHGQGFPHPSDILGCSCKYGEAMDQASCHTAFSQIPQTDEFQVSSQESSWRVVTYFNSYEADSPAPSLHVPIHYTSSDGELGF